MENGHSTTGQQPSAPINPARKTPEQEYHERNRRERANHHERLFIEMVGGKAAHERFTFENFRRAWNQDEAFRAAEAFDPDRDNLYLWGSTGVGKTHLATAIAHKFSKLGYPIRNVVSQEFKDLIRLFEGEHRYAEKIKFIQSLIDARILIFHELGRSATNVSELIQETIWLILERRQLAGRNGLIVTSNFDLKHIGKSYGGTISRRLTELCGPAGIIRFKDRVL